MKTYIEKTYYPNSQVKFEMSKIYGGINHGNQKHFYDNGKLDTSFIWIKGSVESLWQKWHDNGSRNYVYQNKTFSMHGIKIILRYK